jgi:hypothetical protein
MIWSCRAAASTTACVVCERPRQGDGTRSGDWRQRAISDEKKGKWHVDNQRALKLLHRYHAATNTGRLDELDEIFAKDFINFAAGFEPVKSLAAMKTLITELLLAFPDWHVTVEDMFAEDNKVVTRLEPGRHSPCAVSRYPCDRAQDSRRRNSHRSYRR